MPAKENRKSRFWVTRSENRNSRPKGLIFGQNGEILWRRAYRSKSAETLHNLIFGQAKRAREEIAPEGLLGGAHQKTIRKSGNPDLDPRANFQISAMSGRISPEDGSLEPQCEEKNMCGVRTRRARGVQELQISTDLPDPNRLNRGALCAARRRDQGSKKKKPVTLWGPACSTPPNAQTRRRARESPESVGYPFSYIRRSHSVP